MAPRDVVTGEDIQPWAQEVNETLDSVATGADLRDAVAGQVPIADGAGEYSPGVAQAGSLSVTSSVSGRVGVAVAGSQLGFNAAGRPYIDTRGAADGEAAQLIARSRGLISPPLYALTQTGV